MIGQDFQGGSQLKITLMGDVVSYFRVLLGVVLLVSAWTWTSLASAQIRFTDTTETSLRGRNAESWGQSVGDLNNDGWPDIFVNNHRDRHSFYINNGDRTFTDQTLTVDKDSFIAGTYRSIDYHSGAFADIDDDGDTDLFVQWHGVRARSGNWCLFDCEDITNSSLWLNEGDGRLVDRGEQWQMEPPGGSISGMLVDYDRDGDLDAVQGTLGSFILIPRTGPETFGPTQRIVNCARLYSIMLSDLTGDGVAEFTCIREGVFPDGIYRMTTDGLVEITDNIDISPVNSVVDGFSADFDNDLDPDLFFVRGLSVANDALQPTPTSIEAFIDSGRNSDNSEIQFSTSGVIDIAFSPFNKLPPKIWLGDSQLELDVVRDRVIQMDPADTRLHGFPAERSAEVNLYGGYDVATQEWRFMIHPGTRRYEPTYITVESANAISDLQLIGQTAADGALLPRMYRNDESSFVTNTWDAGFREPVQCVSAVGADFDNDMDVDIFLVCKRGSANIANRLYENLGDGTFAEVPGAGGASGPIGAALATSSGWGDSATTGDFDNDGFMDLFVSNGLTTFPVRPDAGPHKIYFGEPNANHWIELELVGTNSVSNAQGAKVIATAAGVSQLREQGSGYHRFSQNHDRLHFGLGANTSVDLSVVWPNGSVESFSDVDADRIYRIVEGSGIAVKPIGAPAQFDSAVPGDECGLPYFESRLDRALLVWKDCDTGDWSVRASAGGGQAWAAEGRLSGTGITSVQPVTLETDDNLQSTSQSIDFNFTASWTDIDGFDFRLDNDTSQQLVSDSSWRVSTVATSGWQSTGFDDSGWTQATEFGNYGVVPWQQRVEGIPTGTQAMWIWSDDNQSDNRVYLRYQVPAGVAGIATINIAADNSHSTWLNGSLLGSGSSWTVASTYSVNLTGGDVVAILADDAGGAAGVLVDIDVAGATICLDWSGPDDVPILLGGQHLPLKTPLSIPDMQPCQSSTPVLLSVADLTVNEGDSAATATVTLTRPTNQDVSVLIHTRPLTAVGGQDFYGFSRNLSISAGDTSAVTEISLVDDADVEATEKFQLRLLNPVNASIANAVAEVSIVDDDDTLSVPSLSIADITVDESVGDALLTATLSQAPTQAVSVVVHTRVGTASGGTDFYGFTRTLNFAVGQTTATTTVTILDDSTAESSEQFAVRMIQPVNAVIGDAQADVVIADND